MKKVNFTFIFVLSISIILLGCSKEEENTKEDLGLEKVKKIEILSVEHPESVLGILDNKDAINDFVNKLMIHKWSIEDIPSGSTKSSVYNMYQEDTVQLGENNTKEKELRQVATITTYKDISYINFQTEKLNFSFKIPKDAAEYLANIKK